MSFKYRRDMDLNLIGNFVNFKGYDTKYTDDYWNEDDIYMPKSPITIPNLNSDGLNLYQLNDDVFECENEKFAPKVTEMNAYLPKILGDKINGISEAYNYCKEHNISNNTFKSDNSEFSEIDLYY